MGIAVLLVGGFVSILCCYLPARYHYQEGGAAASYAVALIFCLSCVIIASKMLLGSG